VSMSVTYGHSLDSKPHYHVSDAGALVISMKGLTLVFLTHEEYVDFVTKVQLAPRQDVNDA